MTYGEQEIGQTTWSSSRASIANSLIAGNQSGRQSESKSPSAPRVLLVDDDPDQREPFETLLQKWGYRVESAECATRALELAENFHPSIALLDLAMPDISGYELAASLKTGLGPKCPHLLAVSGSIDDFEERNRLFERMFTKPVNPAALREVLQTTVPPMTAHHQNKIAAI